MTTATFDQNSDHIATPERSYAILALASLILFAIDACACLTAHWTIGLHSIFVILAGCVAPLIPLSLARYRSIPQIRIACIGTTLFILFANTGAVFSYLVVSTNAPLVDIALAHWDRALGFDWPQVYLWLQHRRLINAVLAIAYASVLPQIIFSTFFLCFIKQTAQLAELYGVMVISLLVTSVVAGFFPAAGASTYYWANVHPDISMLSDFEPLRAGTLRFIDLCHMQGLYSFPSFHAVMAVALAYAMRKNRFALPFIALNVVVILSTPTQGGHYFVDVIGGIVTALMAVFVWKTWAGSTLRKPQI